MKPLCQILDEDQVPTIIVGIRYPGRHLQESPGPPARIAKKCAHFWVLFLELMETPVFAQIHVFAVWALWLDLTHSLQQHTRWVSKSQVLGTVKTRNFGAPAILVPVWVVLWHPKGKKTDGFQNGKFWGLSVTFKTRNFGAKVYTLGE